MNRLIQLESWVSNRQVNTIEIYVGQQISMPVDDDGGVIALEPNSDNVGLSTFGNGFVSTFTTYNYKDLAYSYDMANDAQRVTRRTLMGDCSPHPKMYVMQFDEEVLASHRFPCTSLTSHKNLMTRTSYRINNRMYVYHDIVQNVENGNEEKPSEYVFLRYNHAQNQDLKKMQIDMERVVRMLITPPSRTNASQ